MPAYNSSKWKIKSRNIFISKKRLNNKFRHLRKRKRIIDKLKINTVLLWKLACNYGEVKMKLVQKMMGEYSSEEVELRLFSFKGNTQETASSNALNYRFVKNSSDKRWSCSTVLDTWTNLTGINSLNLNVQKNLKSSSSLEAIEKLSQYLNLIEDKIELLKTHLKGITNGNDRNILNKIESNYETILNEYDNQNDSVSVVEQNSDNEGPDKELVSYDITITRPLDNIEWNLNLAEIEIMDLLLHIKRGDDHEEDVNNRFSMDTEICDNVFEHLPLSSSPLLCETPLINYKKSFFHHTLKRASVFINIKFIQYTKTETIIEKKLNVKINYIHFGNGVSKLFSMCYSKEISKDSEIPAPNIRNTSISTSLDSFQNIITLNYSNYNIFKTNIAHENLCSQEIWNFNKLNLTKLINKFAQRYTLSTGINKYFLQNDFKYWVPSLRFYFKEMEIYIKCLQNNKIDKHKNLCVNVPIDQIVKTKIDPVSNAIFLGDLIVLPKPEPIGDGNIKNGILVCCTRSEFLIEKLSNNNLFINMTTSCHTTPIKRNSVMKLKSKAFTMPFTYVVPKLKSYDTKEICLDFHNDFQEVNVDIPESNLHEEHNKIKTGVNTNIFNEGNYGLEENIFQSLESGEAIELHNVISNANEEHLPILPFCKCDEEVGKTINSKNPPSELILNEMLHKNKDKIYLKHISNLRNKIDKNSKEMEDVLVHFNLLNDKFNGTSKQIEIDVENMFKYVYSLQDSFATTLKLVSGKMNSLSLQVNKSKKVAKRRTKYNYGVVKSFVQNFNCFKPVEECRMIINEECYNKIRLNISKLRLNTLLKFNNFKVHEVINKIAERQKRVDLKLKVSMNKIAKLSNQFNYDKKYLQKLLDENNERINDIANDKMKETLVHVNKIEAQEIVIDSLTERINNLESYLHRTVSLIHKNAESVESHLSHIEENQKHFQVETKQIYSDLSTLNNKVDSNQMELRDSFKDVKILTGSISTNKLLINCMFQEIGILKEKFDVEIWTQSEINKSVESNLEAINNIIKENVIGNRKIGLEELNDFKNIMKRNSLASNASCENLRKLSSQMDNKVLFVQSKVDNILTTLSISDPILVGEASKECLGTSQSLPDNVID